MAVIFSSNATGFPGSITQKVTAIVLVSSCHALTLYSKFEWSVRTSSTNNSYSKLSLNGDWWWSSPIGPNTVYLLGALAFPAWLIASWSIIDRHPVDVNS